MTPQEYDKALAELKDKHQQEIFQLKKKYAFANKKFNIDDIITDGFTTIQVKQLSLYASLSNYPSLCYKGIQLTKDFKVSKRQTDTIIYDNREITKLK